MQNTSSAQENIIKATSELIEQSNGDVKNITARAIALKAGIGLGSINYHFGSKEHLIKVCVQRMIEKVVKGFHLEKQYTTDQERLTATATYVFNFLFNNPAISRISILGDLENYTADCNSIYTQKGFIHSLRNDMEEKDKGLLSFILTATMQVAFLSGTTSKTLLGCDFTIQEERAKFIEKLVNTIMKEYRKEETL